MLLINDDYGLLFSDFPEPGVKLLCKVLPNTLHCYHDAGSRRAVEEVISTLLNHQKKVALSLLVDVLSSFGKSQRAIQHS